MQEFYSSSLQIRVRGGKNFIEEETIRTQELVLSSDDGLTEEARKLLSSYYFPPDKIKGEEKFKVGEVLSSAAFVYEKVRNAVDYKGEHLLRRNAIERILKRLLWENPSLSENPNSLARIVVKELIWARYVQNDSLSVSTLNQIGKSLQKYAEIFEAIKTHYKNKKEKKTWKNWFLGIASSELEFLIDKKLTEQDALSHAMKAWMDKRYEWKDTQIDEEEKSIQLTTATHRSLFKLDLARVRFFMVKHYHKNWMTNPEVNMADLFEKAKEIEEILDSDVQTRLYRYTQKLVAHFHILGYVARRNIDKLEGMFSDKEVLESEVREVCESKYEEIGRRVNTGIVRSIIYIFATKVLVGLLLEVPFEKYILGEIGWIPLVFNLLIPPLLMLVIGLSIRKPGEENTKVILERINDFVYADKNSAVTGFSVVPKKRSGFLNNAFMFFYLLFFLLTFGGIAYLLYWLGYNPFSALIFYMFLSLVLLFGYRVKYNASELNAYDDKEGFVSHFITNLSLPFLKAGLWLSDQVGKINILLIIFDFLIEAPLKSVLKVVDEWTGFVREQREEVVDMPVR
ncbi:hypothetical protein ACFL2C_03730 [Patescibacteria group bacterium]